MLQKEKQYEVIAFTGKADQETLNHVTGKTLELFNQRFRHLQSWQVGQSHHVSVFVREVEYVTSAMPGSESPNFTGKINIPPGMAGQVFDYINQNIGDHPGGQITSIVKIGAGVNIFALVDGKAVRLYAKDLVKLEELHEAYRTIGLRNEEIKSYQESIRGITETNAGLHEEAEKFEKLAIQNLSALALEVKAHRETKEEIDRLSKMVDDSTKEMLAATKFIEQLKASTKDLAFAAYSAGVHQGKSDFETESDTAGYADFEAWFNAMMKGREANGGIEPTQEPITYASITRIVQDIFKAFSQEPDIYTLNDTIPAHEETGIRCAVERKFGINFNEDWDAMDTGWLIVDFIAMAKGVRKPATPAKEPETISRGEIKTSVIAIAQEVFGWTQFDKPMSIGERGRNNTAFWEDLGKKFGDEIVGNILTAQTQGTRIQFVDSIAIAISKQLSPTK